jgi:hypothetical protein
MATPMLERTLYSSDGSIEKVESYSRLDYIKDAQEYADSIRKVEIEQSRAPLSTFRVNGKGYEPGEREK